MVLCCQTAATRECHKSACFFADSSADIDGDAVVGALQVLRRDRLKRCHPAFPKPVQKTALCLEVDFVRKVAQRSIVPF